MPKRDDLRPYDISFNPDDKKFYLHDTRTEDGRTGAPINKPDGTPAIYSTWAGATAYARRLLCTTPYHADD